MDLNDLLRGKGIDPHEVLVFRHRPTESGRRARLCAASRQETSNVNVTVGIHVGPDDRRTIAVRLGYNC
jgi:hypothetical protein